MLHLILMLNIIKIQTKKDPKFKVGDFVRISNYKNIFAKGYTPNWSEEIFIVNEIENTVPWTYVISDLDGEVIAGSFYEKELQKTSQEKLRIEKVIKRKKNHLILGLIEKILYKLCQYFPKPFKNFGGNINVKVDLSNYATKK